MGKFSSQPSGRSESGRVSPTGFLPRLESLEDRAVPAITVGPNIDVTQFTGVFGQDEMEVDIAVNPTNPNNIIVAPIDTNTLFSTGQDRVWITFDGGTNWTPVAIPNIDPTNEFALGDPTVVFDRTGRAVYGHLSVNLLAGSLHLAGAVSTDGGATWTPTTITPSFTIQQPPNLPAFFIFSPLDDKEFLSVGPDVNDLSRDRFYVGYQDAFRNGAQMFSSSTDGINWTKPVQVSDTGNTGIDSEIAVGNNGEVYYVWAKTNFVSGQLGDSPIFIDISYDGGVTWGEDRVVARTSIDTFSDPGSGGGRYLIPAQPERGIGPSPRIDVDRSNGPNRGAVYVAFADQADNDGSPDAGNPTDHNNLDVFVVRSTDGGRTFSQRVRVNDDTTLTSQFSPWLDVDPITGAVGLMWYDARFDIATNQFVDVFFSVSSDGINWEPNVRVTEGRSNEAIHFNLNDYLEYINLEMFDGVAYMTWADNSNSTGNNPDGALSGLDTYFATATFTFPEIVVIDVSESMVAIDGFDVNSDGVLDNLDDLNGDGLRGTPLDIALYFAINDRVSVVGGEVALLIMGRTTEALDLSAAAGVQVVGSSNADTDGDGVTDLEQVLRSIRVGRGGDVFSPAKTVDPSRSFYDNALQMVAALVTANPTLTDAVFYSDGSGRLPLISFGLADVILAGTRVETVLVGPYQSTNLTLDFTRIATATGGLISPITNLRHTEDGGWSPDRFTGTVTGLSSTTLTSSVTMNPPLNHPFIIPGSAIQEYIDNLTDEEYQAFREQMGRTTNPLLQATRSERTASLRNRAPGSGTQQELVDSALENLEDQI